MNLSELKRTLMPNTYVRLLTQEFSDLAAITAGTGIPATGLADYPHPVTVAQHLRCIANILPLRRSPDWHLQWGKRMAENFHGPVTLACLTAPTLGEGLDVLVKYMPSRVPYLDWRSRQAGGEFRCEVVPRLDVGAVRAMVIEVPLLVMHEYVRVMHPGPLTGARIELDYAATEYRARYAAYFDCPVSFEHPVSALVIPRAWRGVANLDFDAEAWRVALARCAASASPAASAEDVVGRVRELLQEALVAPGRVELPTVAQVAARLHCSARTVIRRLRAAGTSYQALSDAERMRRAGELLVSHRVQDVAARLGFADAASFRKAFRRWHACTPADWRDAASRQLQNIANK